MDLASKQHQSVSPSLSLKKSETTADFKSNKRNCANMSLLTQEINTDAEFIMKNMDVHTKEQELKSMGNNKNLDKIDFVELIRKAGVEIKALNYKANKITASSDGKNNSAGKELRVGVLQEIDAIPDEYIFLKARINGLKDPLKFSIIWAPNIPPRVRADLKIYLSLTCKEPDYFNHT